MTIRLKCNHAYSGNCNQKLEGVIAYIPFINEQKVEVDLYCKEFRDTKRDSNWINLFFMEIKAKSRKQLQRKLRKNKNSFEKMLEKNLGKLDIGGIEIKKEMYEKALENYQKLIDNDGYHPY